MNLSFLVQQKMHHLSILVKLRYSLIVDKKDLPLQSNDDAENEDGAKVALEFVDATGNKRFGKLILKMSPTVPIPVIKVHRVSTDAMNPTTTMMGLFPKSEFFFLIMK